MVALTALHVSGLPRSPAHVCCHNYLPLSPSFALALPNRRCRAASFTLAAPRHALP